MLSIEYKKHIADYSIKKTIREDRLAVKLEEKPEDMLDDPSQDKYIERIQIKTKAALMFKKFYAEKLGELKYELKLHQSRLIYFFCRRGQRRELEKKKFKALGEMKIICEILFNVQKRQNLIEDVNPTKNKGAELRMEKTMGFLTSLLHDNGSGYEPHLFSMAKRNKTKKNDKEKEK